MTDSLTIELAKRLDDLEKRVRYMDTIGSAGWEIDTYLDTGAAASIDITSIPQYARNLRVVVSCRTVTNAATDTLSMTINADGAANYGSQYVQGQAAVASSAEVSGAAYILCGQTSGNTATAGYFSVHDILIPDYASANKNKQILIANYNASAFAAGNRRVRLLGTDWRILAAITQLTFTATSGSNLAQYTRVTIYGLG